MGDAGWFPEALLGGEEPTPTVPMSLDFEESSPVIRNGAGAGISPGRSGSAVVPSRAPEARGSPSVSKSNSLQALDRHSAEDRQILPVSSRPSSTTRPSRGRGREDLSKQDSNRNLHEDTKLSGLEEAGVRAFEQRLAQCAQSRRRFARDCESAQRGASEAEIIVETTERLLVSLEEQERRCRAEASCVASSNSTSLRKSAEARLRILQEKKEAAAQELRMARERIEAEKRNALVAKRKLRLEQQAASSAMEAISRQRDRVRAAVPQQQAAPPQIPALAISNSLSSPALASVRPQTARTQGQSAARPSAAGQTSASSRLKQRPVAATGSSVAARAAAGRTRSHSPSKVSTPRGRQTPASPVAHGGASASAPSAALGPAAGAAASPAWGAPSTARTSSRAAGRGTSSTGGQGTPLRRLGSPQQRSPRAVAPSRPAPESPARGPPPGAAEAAPRLEMWPAGTTEEELSRASEALQSAEQLQAKLAGMPEHLKASILRQCPGLQGLLAGD